MLKLYRAFKYDNRYDYVKMFKSREEQNAFFDSLNSITIEEYNVHDNVGYIKEGESFCVDFNKDYLMSNGYNYLSFDNDTKIFYAFITNKEYVNEETTRLYYEIDVVQTFMFNFIIKKSFVERKKCTIDEICDFDEGLDIGEHSIINEYKVHDKTSKYFAMFNGMKEQSITLNPDGRINNCIDIPYVTSKPLSIIDGIQYPLYFMPLEQTYSAPKIVPIKPDIVITDGVVGSMRKLIGKPYSYGGNLPPLDAKFGNDNMGTDCSGAVMWAYNDSGLINQCQQTLRTQRWTTYNMYANTRKVPISQAKIGDVLFCNFSSQGVPEHVKLIVAIDSGLGRITTIEASGLGAEHTAPNYGMPPRWGVKEVTSDFHTSSEEIGRLIYI